MAKKTQPESTQKKVWKTSEQVTPNSVVTLDYNVVDCDGNIVDEGREPLIYLHGGYHDIFPLIEEALDGQPVSSVVTVKLQPEEAFGNYSAEQVQVEPRESFPHELEVGMHIEGFAAEAAEEDEAVIYRVTDIADDRVVLDANHPLAGIALIFTCTVTAIRPASQEEIQHGHVHLESSTHPEHLSTCH